jgi:hypothetical protein
MTPTVASARHLKEELLGASTIACTLGLATISEVVQRNSYSLDDYATEAIADE